MIVVSLNCWCLLAFSQKDIDPDIQTFMKQATEQMNQEDYKGANHTFRQILASGKVIPTDMTFLFAHTLYMVDQFQNSQNFLDKYLRLTGRTGRYYRDALELKHVLEKQIEEILSCSLCNSHGYRLQPCTVCHQTGILSNTCSYCKGVGVTRCEVCDGLGVLVTKNPLGEDHYQTCSNCNGKSQVACKVCSGAKVETTKCTICRGTHFEATEVLCDHKDEVTSY